MENEKGIIVQQGTSEEFTLKEYKKYLETILEKLDKIDKKLDARAF